MPQSSARSVRNPHSHKPSLRCQPRCSSMAEGVVRTRALLGRLEIESGLRSASAQSTSGCAIEPYCTHGLHRSPKFAESFDRVFPPFAHIGQKPASGIGHKSRQRNVALIRGNSEHDPGLKQEMCLKKNHNSLNSLPAIHTTHNHLQSRRLRVRCAAASTANQNPSSDASPSDPGLAGRAIVVVTLVAFSLVLCNADRAIMSVAILPLAKSRGWGESVAGIVQSSFLWGYLFTPVLGGALADKLGGRQVRRTIFCTPRKCAHC